jgi:hypothetical protein
MYPFTFEFLYFVKREKGQLYLLPNRGSQSLGWSMTT